MLEQALMALVSPLLAASRGISLNASIDKVAIVDGMSFHFWPFIKIGGVHFIVLLRHALCAMLYAQNPAIWQYPNISI